MARRARGRKCAGPTAAPQEKPQSGFANGEIDAAREHTNRPTSADPRPGDPARARPTTPLSGRLVGSRVTPKLMRPVAIYKP